MDEIEYQPIFVSFKILFHSDIHTLQK